jgi:proteasome lid subunit RPN8/RPN11
MARRNEVRGAAPMLVALRTVTVDLAGEVYDLVKGVSRVRGDHALVATYPRLFGPIPSRKRRARRLDPGAARRSPTKRRWWDVPVAAPSLVRAQAAPPVELVPGPPRVAVAISATARDAILAEMFRLDRSGVEVAGWLSGRGARYAWHPIDVVRAGAASLRNRPHAVGPDLDEFDRQVRLHDAAEGDLEVIGDFHSQPDGDSEPSDHDLRAWRRLFGEAEERGLARYVSLIATHDHRPGRYRPATLAAYLTRRDERRRIVTERAYVT